SDDCRRDEVASSHARPPRLVRRFGAAPRGGPIIAGRSPVWSARSPCTSGVCVRAIVAALREDTVLQGRTMSGAHVITAVEPFVVEVPMKAPTHGVHGTVSTQRSALVRVVSDQGAEGWGNVDTTVGYSTSTVAAVVATIRRFAPVLRGAGA